MISSQNQSVGKTTRTRVIHLKRLDSSHSRLFKNPASDSPLTEPLPPWKHFYLPTKYLSRYPLRLYESPYSTRVNQIYNTIAPDFNFFRCLLMDQYASLPQVTHSIGPSMSQCWVELANSPQFCFNTGPMYCVTRVQELLAV